MLEECPHLFADFEATEEGGRVWYRPRYVKV
jgi:hypothetical protein